MNARQRCRERRQMRYREQCKKEDEIRLLRLGILRGYEEMTRSTEEIIDSVWRKSLNQKKDDADTLGDFIFEFKCALKISGNKQCDSFTNRCLPNVYLYYCSGRKR